MQLFQAVEEGKKIIIIKKAITITKDTKLLLPSSLFYEHSPFTFHIINHVFNNGIKASTEATHLRQMGNASLKLQVGM